MKALGRFFPLILIVVLVILVFQFSIDQYLSFDTLKNHRHELISWRNQHFLLLVLSYMLIYIIAVALSVPGALFITLAGGFIFGIWVGTLLVVISATIGACCIFLAVKVALSGWMSKKAGNWVAKMQVGFQENAFQYLLVLRFIPLFPFWVVNIVPALLDVRLRVFALATLIGIIPGSLVYVTVGNGLGHVFDAGKQPNLSMILEPEILFPLVGLAILSIVPILYKYFRKKRHGKNSSN